MRLKIEGARRQLGTALAFYLGDHDPVSVHCLAGGGCKVIDFYAKKAGQEPFVTHILNENSHLDIRKVRHLQRQYWTSTGPPSSTRRGRWERTRRLSGMTRHCSRTSPTSRTT